MPHWAVNELCFCAVHRALIWLPNVQEKIHFLIYPEWLSKIGPRGILSRGTKILVPKISYIILIWWYFMYFESSFWEKKILKSKRCYPKNLPGLHILKKYASGPSLTLQHGFLLHQDPFSCFRTETCFYDILLVIIMSIWTTSNQSPLRISPFF